MNGYYHACGWICSEEWRISLNIYHPQEIEKHRRRSMSRRGKENEGCGKIEELTFRELGLGEMLQ